jgi:hypothetical protein
MTRRPGVPAGAGDHGAPLCAHLEGEDALVLLRFGTWVGGRPSRPCWRASSDPGQAWPCGLLRPLELAACIAREDVAPGRG